MLRVRHRRRQDLLDLLRRMLLREPEQRQRLVDVLPPDLVDHQSHLVRRLSGRTLDRACFSHDQRPPLPPGAPAPAAAPAPPPPPPAPPPPAGAPPPTDAFLSTILPLCPRNSRVGANSPSLCPTMFSVMYTGMNLFP